MFSYNVTLSYVTLDDHVTESMLTTMNSSALTGLPDDTEFNITVSGIGVMQDILTFDSTSVSTIAFESMYNMYIVQFNKGVCLQNVRMLAYTHSYIHNNYVTV